MYPSIIPDASGRDLSKRGPHCLARSLERQMQGGSSSRWRAAQDPVRRTGRNIPGIIARTMLLHYLAAELAFQARSSCAMVAVAVHEEQPSNTISASQHSSGVYDRLTPTFSKWWHSHMKDETGRRGNRRR